MADYSEDQRIVLTLDAGGTNFVFSAMQANEVIIEPNTTPSYADDLEAALDAILEGFRQVLDQLDTVPSAISFAFPGPADYHRGVIGPLGNLPAFDHPVALGPMLEDHFNLPVYINNDGDLFTYGEALAGFLPHVNMQLEAAGNEKRYRNLFGVTLGTGFGGGFVIQDTLLRGDNSAASEIWLLRDKIEENMCVEEGISIRAIRRYYALETGVDFPNTPSPFKLYEIAQGNIEGDREAARNAFVRFGEVLGDALANAVTLTDSLIVIGGGIAKAHPFFLPRAIQEMNGTYDAYGGKQHSRLESRVYNLEDPKEFTRFCDSADEETTVPRSDRTIRFSAEKRIGIGVTVMDTSEAVALGAYNFALHELDLMK